MTIRQATVEDLPNMGECAGKFYASSKVLRDFDLNRFCELWRSLLDSGMGVIFVLEDEGKIHGAIGGVKYPDTYSARQVATEFFWFVDPASRGAGLSLYHLFEKWAREQSCDEIRMVHLADSMPEKLERVYRHLGFERVEVHYRKEFTQ